MVDMNDPESRGAYIESVGPDAYNEAMRKHLADSTVCTVNGRTIRKVFSRFGTLYVIEGYDVAYDQLTKAKAVAAILTTD